MTTGIILLQHSGLTVHQNSLPKTGGDISLRHLLPGIFLMRILCQASETLFQI